MPVELVHLPSPGGGTRHARTRGCRALSKQREGSHRTPPDRGGGGCRCTADGPPLKSLPQAWPDFGQGSSEEVEKALIQRDHGGRRDTVRPDPGRDHSHGEEIKNQEIL